MSDEYPPKRKNFRDYTAIYQDNTAKRYYTFSHISHYREQRYPVARVLDDFLKVAIKEQEAREIRLMASLGYNSVTDFEQDYLNNAYNVDILSDLVIEKIFDKLTIGSEFYKDWEKGKKLFKKDFDGFFGEIETVFTNFIDNYQLCLQILGKNSKGVTDQVIDELKKIKASYAGLGNNDRTMNKTALRKLVDKLMSKMKGGSLRGDIGELGVEVAAQETLDKLRANKNIKIDKNMKVNRATHKLNPKADVKLGEVGFQSKNYRIRGDYFDFAVHSKSTMNSISNLLKIYSRGSFNVDAFVFNFVNIYNLTNSGQKDGKKAASYESFSEWDNILACLRSAATIWLGSTLGFDGGKVFPYSLPEKNDFTDVDFFVVGQKRIQRMSSLLKYIDNNIDSIYPKISTSKTYEPNELYEKKKASVSKYIKGTSLVYPEPLRKIGSAAGKDAAKAEITMKFKILVSSFTTREVK